MRHEIQSSVACLAIEGELTSCSAAEVCESLKEALAFGTDLEINLEGVTELDSTGIQLLLSTRRAALAAHQEMHLVGHSPAVLEIFEALGLDADLVEATSHPPRLH